MSKSDGVGDTQADLKAADKAKVGYAIGVLSGAHSREQLEVCPHDFISHSVKDLPEIVSIPKCHVSFVSYLRKPKKNLASL